MDGKDVSVHYIQIYNDKNKEKENFIEILEPQFKGEDLRIAVSKIHMKISAGSWYKGRYKEEMQIYTRNGSEEGAIFPAIAPKFIIQDIFQDELDRLDTKYRAIESADGRSLINIESSGW